MAGLSYSIILGDSFSSIASLTGATGVLASSNFWIIALSAFVLLPLALLRDLSSLAIGSVVGTAGTLYTGRHAPANATKPPRRHFRSAAEMRPRSVALAQLPSSSCAFSTRATLPAANILPLSPRARSLHSLPRPLRGLCSTLRCSC